MSRMRFEMGSQRIVIAGAGLAGLAVGKCLRAKNIPAIILDSHSGKPRNHYAITLHAWAYKPLLDVLEVNEAAFRKQFEVFPTQMDDSSMNDQGSNGSFRCRRKDLEGWLGQDLDIRWGQKIDDIELTQPEIQIKIRNEVQKISAGVVIGADGEHSTIRQSMDRSPVRSTPPKVLPYAVFSGRRTFTREQFDLTIRPYMQAHLNVEFQHEGTLLRAAVDEYDSKSVMIIYIYSRPAMLDREDRLYMPDRSPGAAKVEAQYLWNELESELGDLPSLPPVFAEIFDIKKMKEDRLLNWLMRSVTPDLANLQNAARNSIIMVGDAAHAMPILGGQGANTAIQDAVNLAKVVSQSTMPDYKRFISDSYTIWAQAVRDSEQRLSDMHAIQKPSL